MRALRRRTTAALLAPALLAAAATGSAVLLAAPAEAATEPVTKILTIVEENHSTAQMRSQMPYLDSLGAEYGQATGYTATQHPSEPNYLAIAGGSTFGVGDDADPSAHRIRGQSVFGQATAAGLTSGTYAQAMPSACALTGDADRGYAVKHNPQAFFVDERAHCRATNRSTARFQADAAANALPEVGFLVPDTCHDAHDCSLGTADAYLRQQLPAVLASTDFTSGRLAVVVTADEDDRSGGNGVYTVVLQAGLSGRTVTTPLTHYSLSRLISQVVGAPGLRRAASAPDMAAAFGLDVGPGRPSASPPPTTPTPTSSGTGDRTPLRVSVHADRSGSTAVPADGSLVVSGKVYFFTPARATRDVRFTLDSGRARVERHEPFDLAGTRSSPAHLARALDTRLLANGEHRVVADSAAPGVTATTYTFTVRN